MTRRGGFTMVELMITIVLLAILLAIGLPSFYSLLRNASIRSASESVQSGMQLARMEALRRNQRVTFWLVNDVTAGCARTAAGPAWVVSIDSPVGACDATPSRTSAPRIVQTRTTSETSNVQIAASDSVVGGNSVSCVTFNGFGQVEAACTGGGNPIASISLSSTIAGDGTRAMDIRVTAGGDIRSCIPSLTDTNDPRYCH